MSDHTDKLNSGLQSVYLGESTVASVAEPDASYEPAEAYNNDTPASYTSLSYPPILVSVTEPATRNGANYVTYKVCIHDANESDPDAVVLDGIAASFSVRHPISHVTYRRFNHFYSFRELLHKAYPGVLVPAVPEKEGIWSSQDPAQRSRALHLFLCRVASHPVLAGSRMLKTFLQGEDSDLDRLLAVKIPDVSSVEQLLCLIPGYCDKDSKHTSVLGTTLDKLTDELTVVLPYDYYGHLLYCAQLIVSPTIDSNIQANTNTTINKNSNGPNSAAYSIGKFSFWNMVSSVQGIISNMSAAAHASTDKGTLPRNADCDRLDLFVVSTEERFRELITLCTTHMNQMEAHDTAQDSLSSLMLKVASFEEEHKELVSATALQTLSNSLKEVVDLRRRTQECDKSLLFELFSDVLRNLTAVRDMLQQRGAVHHSLEVLSKTIALKKDRLTQMPGYNPAVDSKSGDGNLSSDPKIRDAQYELMSLDKAMEKQSQFLKQITNGMMIEIQWWREVKRTCILNSVKKFAQIQASITTQTAEIWQHAETAIANIRVQNGGGRS